MPRKDPQHHRQAGITGRHRLSTGSSRNRPVSTRRRSTASFPHDRTKPYDMYEVLARIIDGGDLDEYKAGYGKTIITGYARIDGWAVGIVANQRSVVKTRKGEMQVGGVIYSDSADKAARFIMNCNQKLIPLVFLQDVTGFMVGQPGRAGRDHQGRREDGECRGQQRRPEIHLHRRQQLRRRQLCDVRQGVRSAAHLRLADGADRRHGGEAGERDAAEHPPASSRRKGNAATHERATAEASGRDHRAV